MLVSHCDKMSGTVRDEAGAACISKPAPHVSCSSSACVKSEARKACCMQRCGLHAEHDWTLRRYDGCIDVLDEHDWTLKQYRGFTDVLAAGGGAVF